MDRERSYSRLHSPEHADGVTSVEVVIHFDTRILVVCHRDDEHEQWGLPTAAYGPEDRAAVDVMDACIKHSLGIQAAPQDLSEPTVVQQPDGGKRLVYRLDCGPAIMGSGAIETDWNVDYKWLSRDEIRQDPKLTSVEESLVRVFGEETAQSEAA